MKEKSGKEIQSTIVVMISANAEWRVVRNYFTKRKVHSSPFGEWFYHKYKTVLDQGEPIVFMHGGWGKVAAAASTQYAIDHWRPKIIINLGTCGGFDGYISRGEIILADKTIIYDIYEQMGDLEEHIKFYTTEIDNRWISKPYPISVRQSLLVSADRDLIPTEIPNLKAKYGAIAGDWESGAIAWITKKNQTMCLILRGVTDLVGGNWGEAYNGNINLFYENAEAIMKILLDSLPEWILNYYKNFKTQNS